MLDKSKQLVIRSTHARHHPGRKSTFPFSFQRPAEYARERLNALDVEVYHWNLHNFEPEDLLYARFDSPALKTLIEQLKSADGLIVATPIYKASFSGALKTLLDLLPERALDGKVVLPLATGGTVAHLLAVDYALKPVLNALKAQEILHGVFADDSQVIDYQHKPHFTPNLQTRLDTALETFWHALHRRDIQAPAFGQPQGVAHV